jgi:predicted GNAT family acetyltransferase
MPRAPRWLGEDMSDVVHVPEQSRFELEAGGQVAVLTYEEGDGDVALVHTVVPPELEGQGIGGELAEAAVGWVRGRGLEVVPVCSFVQTWLQRHPEALQ